MMDGAAGAFAREGAFEGDAHAVADALKRALRAHVARPRLSIPSLRLVFSLDLDHGDVCC